MEGTGDFFKISIYVYGVKRKCRKSERHIFSMGYLPYNDGNFNQEELTNKVNGFIETNMKKVESKVSVALHYVERKKDDFGMVESWALFGNKSKEFVIKSKLENVLD